MKKIFLVLATVALTTPLLTSCIEEVEPQTSTVTEAQASRATKFYDSSVAGLTSSLVGRDGNYAEHGAYKPYFAARELIKPCPPTD